MATNIGVHMAFLLFTSLLLAVEWNCTVRAAFANSSQLFSPECLPDCGNGVQIPYPFGVGTREYCFLSESFRVECKGNKPYLSGQFYYEITDIRFPEREVRTLTPITQVCDGWKDCVSYPKLGENLRFSPSKNKFTAVGCDTLGTMHAEYNSSRKIGLGCLTTCQDSRDSLVADYYCSGFGCCQTSIPPGLDRISLANIKPDNVTLFKAEDTDGSRLCGYVFLVEDANYTFKKSHLSWRGTQTFPVVLDFFIANTCERAQTNMSTYACKDSRSVCKNLRDELGYFCICSLGYRGNPYLQDGCYDIDECLYPSTFPCDGICVNMPGSYLCKSKSKINLTIGIIIGVSSGLGALIFLIVITFVYKRIQIKKLKVERERRFCNNYNMLRQQHELNSSDNASLIERIKFFTLKDIKKATDNFDSTRIVGQGGHGTVYKGLLELKVVAIKRPKMLVQDEILEYLNEVILLSQISHRNVVQLIGCCLETEVPLLVYEFISNGTLFDHLHMHSGEASLSWVDRLRIATEISAGLSYLHTAANVFILHRDIKSTNILLDERLTAKISDFGASKAIEVEQTHLTTNIQGTLGYIDPEYMHTGQLTNKTDVYSLGVILVELLTGQRPTSTLKCQQDGNLVSHFKAALTANKLLEVVDAYLVANGNVDEVHLVAELAVDCLNMRGIDRPSMKDIEMTLEGYMKGKKKRYAEDNTTKHDTYEIFTGDTYMLWSGGNTRDESTTQLNIEECTIPLHLFQR